MYARPPSQEVLRKQKSLDRSGINCNSEALHRETQGSPCHCITPSKEAYGDESGINTAMPTANFYIQDENVGHAIGDKAREIRAFLAARLSCGDRKLTPEEISLRVIQPVHGSMIAPLEVEILAFAYATRVKEQDIICRDVVSFLQQCDCKLPTAHVWLALCELGHSWQD